MRAKISAGAAAVLAGVAYGVVALLAFESGEDRALIESVGWAVLALALLGFGYELAAGRVHPGLAILIAGPFLFTLAYFLVTPLGIGIGAIAQVAVGAFRQQPVPAAFAMARRRAAPWPFLLFAGGLAFLWASSRLSPPAGDGAMSVAFLALVPLAIGYLAVALDRREEPRTRRIILLPLLATAACMATVLATGLEGTICMVMALPPFLIAATTGGFLAATVRRRVPRGPARRAVLTGILLLPFAFGVLESLVPAAASRRTVAASIRIRADAQTVWRNVVLPTGIQPGENRMRLAHRMGFPRPVTATLSHEGVGGSRYAIFERGVMLRETVTEWVPRRRMAFTIDPANIPREVLDEHVTIGGRFFDVTDGAYEVVPIAPGEVELRLRTTHRLSTHVNPYAGFWTDLLMREIQKNLLHVVRARAEAGR